MASLKDIAEKTGVSIRTVNRALKGDEKIKEATKKIVLAAAKELNYIPNLAARALKSGGGYEVIAVINNLHEMHLRKFAAMEKVLREKELLLSIFIVEDENCCEDLLKRLSLSRPAGAVLMADYDNQEQYDLIKGLWKIFDQQDIPCLGIDLDFEGMSQVILDRSKAIYDSITYLQQKGYKDIAYAGIEGAFGNDERIEGYKKAVKTHSLKENIFLAPLAVGDEARVESGKLAMEHFAKFAKRPQAIQFFTDMMAVSALQYCQQNGIKVPEDLAIIGFDNQPITAFTQPPLTTISQPVERVGEISGKLLCDLIKSSNSVSYTKFVDADLVERAST
ncbi:LacI family DNA-binding transcriptional regulator [Lentisphaera profundi]|uniref:LacI family DNA-binding transcriptional regulator n=1 Tax=Lentisphaera profundi TaxID=1658616 RepID=A0ABY7VR78_9BACT|nr:LacI family DNA-binding transcriptional regulator [Lentisphaera profundi]WDE95740.1 LacI family DNA-binding transcriptional regulator [Lentisphaera profundi]